MVLNRGSLFASPLLHPFWLQVGRSGAVRPIGCIACAASVMPPRSRTRNDEVSVQAVVDALRPHALLRQAPWDWEVSKYSKCKRTQSADRAGLGVYKGLLAILLRLAPRCFPPHRVLRSAWIELHSEYGIKHTALSSMSVSTWADEVANTIRVMMKHLLDLARSGGTFTADLRLLVSMVDVRPQGEATLAADAPSLKVDSDSSEVEIEHVVCNCSACRPPFEFVASSEEDGDVQPPSEDKVHSPARSETSLAAANNIRTVDANRGGHKRSVQQSKPHGRPTKKPARELEVETPPASGAAVAAAAVPGDVRVVHRQKPPGKEEAYIMQGGKYVATLRRARHPAYLALVTQVADELRRGDMQSSDAVKARIKELASQPS